MTMKTDNQGVIGIIPARYASTRLPGKMLADIAGAPLIVRTLEAVMRSERLGSVIVATDDSRIAEAATSLGVEAVMTDAGIPSGSDRILSALQGREYAVAVNIQGDEPMIPPRVIDSTVDLLLANESFQVTTPSVRIDSAIANNPNIVKVVTDRNHRALYFSRSVIPFARYNSSVDKPYQRHVGLYCYRKSALETFCGHQPVEMEKMESLEQLRLLYLGIPVGVVEVPDFPNGVDTREDLERIRSLFID